VIEELEAELRRIDQELKEFITRIQNANSSYKEPTLTRLYKRVVHLFIKDENQEEFKKSA